MQRAALALAAGGTRGHLGRQRRLGRVLGPLGAVPDRGAHALQRLSRLPAQVAQPVHGGSTLRLARGDGAEAAPPLLRKLTAPL